MIVPQDHINNEQAYLLVRYGISIREDQRGGCVKKFRHKGSKSNPDISDFEGKIGAFLIPQYNLPNFLRSLLY